MDIDIRVFLGDLLKVLPKLNEVDARIVMQDRYEITYGIFNHGSDQKRPFSSVAMFESENFTERSSYYDALVEYAENNYRELWGLSVHEFLDQPQYIVKMMREATKEIMTRKNQMMNSVQAQIDHDNKSRSKGKN